MKQQKAVQKQKKKEKSRVKPTVEVYTIKPISMTLEEEKNEELTEIPDHDQLYANSTKVRFLDEKKVYEPDNWDVQKYEKRTTMAVINSCRDKKK